MRRPLLVALMLASLSLSALAAWHSVLQVTVGGGFTPSCSQSTTALARLDGAENLSAVDALICGLQTDGNYTRFDALWLLTINSLANAETNVATSSSFNITVGSAGTFTANAGLAGNGSTAFYNTNFTPSTAGGQYTLNDGSVGVCVLNSSTATGAIAVMGTQSGGSYIYASPNNTASTITFDLNDGSFPNATQTSNNIQASWIISRTTGSGVEAAYENGAILGTGSAIAAVSLPANAMYLLAYNNAGTAAQFSSATLGYAFVGGPLTSTQVTQIYNRLHTYMQAVNPGGAC